MKLYEVEERGYTDAFYGKDKSENYNGVEFTSYVIGQERFLLNFLGVVNDDAQ